MDADGDFVVAWVSHGQDGSDEGLFAQRYTAAGVPAGGEFQVNTYTAFKQREAAVAMDADGDFVIAWQSLGQGGSGGGVYAQRYTADGVPAGAEFRVSTFTTDGQGSPAVAMSPDGNFVVAWPNGNYRATLVAAG